MWREESGGVDGYVESGMRCGEGGVCSVEWEGFMVGRVWSEERVME